MKRILITTTAAVAVAVMALGAVGGAVAQGQPGAGPGAGPGQPNMQRALSPEDLANRRAEIFKALDANGDGTVTQEEFVNRDQNQSWNAFVQAQRQQRRDARFAAIDADGDGTISQEEWRAHQPTQMGHRGMGHRGMGHHGGMGMGMGPGPAAPQQQ